MEDTGYRSRIWMQLQVYERPREQILPMLRQKCLYYVSNKTGAKFIDFLLFSSSKQLCLH
jgi:hypothetical protein